MESYKNIGITEVVVRDGIQSLLATRVPLRDLVSILPILDKVGYWSLETWGGATYDSCIRYLNEDPWERLRTFNSLLKNTPQHLKKTPQLAKKRRHNAKKKIRLNS